MYVPNEVTDEPQDFGEVHVGFTPSEGIQSIHHVKEIPVAQTASIYQQHEASNSFHRSHNSRYLNYSKI